MPKGEGHTDVCSPARHTVGYGHRTGQTQPQLLCREKTEFGSLGRKVLTLKPDLAMGTSPARPAERPPPGQRMPGG
ncbi:hypothetical protein AV530_016072 [Patagioenas fasciata monilis]|uniref:Uncharacterized protein n=1 Tax=Patagioenas fasciata monilis TaxID=372326 RepID=A0A1V4KK55_PATFA|nr:hypothetical protein AV530_016072 [Patagioenas fasciata monilis]